MDPHPDCGADTHGFSGWCLPEYGAVYTEGSDGADATPDNVIRTTNSDVQLQTSIGYRYLSLFINCLIIHLMCKFIGCLHPFQLHPEMLQILAQKATTNTTLA